MDFYDDWAQDLRERLEAWGCSVPSDTPSREIVVMYWRIWVRLIEPRPRVVTLARHMPVAHGHWRGLKALLRKLERGDDVHLHMSKRIVNAKFNDGLLNDWGIHHFHLGLDFDHDGYASRTGSVLFAMVKPEIAYCIAVMPHRAWTKQRVLRTLHATWPKMLGIQLTGIYPSSRTPSDKRVADMRRAGVQPLLQIKGQVYGPPGGGYATDGTSVRAVMLANRWGAAVVAIQTSAQAAQVQLATDIGARGYALPPRLDFKLLRHAGGFGIKEKSTGAVFHALPVGQAYCFALVS